MDIGTLELKIISDSNGKSIELDNLSIQAAKSLNTFLDSLINIADRVSIKNRESLKIKVKKGSASVAIEGFTSDIETIGKNFEEVANNKSSNKDLVNSWRAIQYVILANGLNYEANIITPQKGIISLIDKIKLGSEFKAKSKRNKSDTNIAFLKGKLIAIGGLNPNFHLYNENQEETIVHCDEETAKKINSFLYNEIYVSTWCKSVPGTKPNHTYGDLYINESNYIEFRDFITKEKSKNDSEEFIKIHDKIKEIIEHQDFGKLIKFLRLYNHPSVEVATLKTILVNTKAFNFNPDIFDIRNSLKKILERKIDKSLI
jgi:hypothetical protein